jgi:GTP-binding protein
VLFTSAVLAVSWERFIERRLREEFDFTGNPIKIIVRERVREERT